MSINQKTAYDIDLASFVGHLFGDGDPPPCPEEGDVTGDGQGPDIVDLTQLVEYLFGVLPGPPPPACP